MNNNNSFSNYQNVLNALQESNHLEKNRIYLEVVNRGSSYINGLVKYVRNTQGQDEAFELCSTLFCKISSFVKVNNYRG